MKMFNGFFGLQYPQFAVVEDEGGAAEPEIDKEPGTDDEPPVDADKDKTPAPPAEKEDENTEISDDEFAGLRDVLSPEQFESINQTRHMNKRMREKMAKIEKERALPKSEPPKPKSEDKPNNPGLNEKEFDPLKWFGRTDRGARIIERWRKMGKDDDDIRCDIDAIGLMSQEISMLNVQPVSARFQENDFKEALNIFSGEEKYKFGMSKPEIRKAVESYVRNNYEPAEWNKPETIKAAYGIALAEHPEIFTTQGKREIVEDGGIHEKSTGGDTRGSGGVSSAEMKEYAETYGIDLNDKNARKAVIDGIIAKRKAEKRME